MKTASKWIYNKAGNRRFLYLLVLVIASQYVDQLDVTVFVTKKNKIILVR